MQPVKVIWRSYNPEAISRGYWDQGILEDLFKRPGEYEWQHQEDFKDLSENEGGVVIINGRMHPNYIEAINRDLNKLRWVVLIITGDEEAVFPFENIRHPLLRVWMQLPRMNRHNDVSFKLPNGPRTGTLQMVKSTGQQGRTLDYFFAGQINHDRREQCRDAVGLIEDIFEGQFIPTDGFGKEAVDQPTYINLLAHTKIALCPSGIETPDTFRLYEALEAGCVPVVDAFATRNQSNGFWKYLFGEDVPFPIVDYWDKLPVLLPELLREYPHNANKVSAWWQNKKRGMYLKLINDIKEISR